MSGRDPVTGEECAITRPASQMRRGQLHDNRVDVGEPPQRRALVLDAVLHTGHRDVRTRRGFEAFEHAGGVLALDREQHDIVVAPGDLLGERDDTSAICIDIHRRRRAPRIFANERRAPPPVFAVAATCELCGRPAVTNVPRNRCEVHKT